MNSAVNFRDRALLAGWIAGLLLFISLIWILTQPLLAQNLLRTVNNVFINNGDPRRVSASIPGNSAPHAGGKTGLLGYWYSMHDSTDRMFVFAFFQDGILCPLGAVVSANGKVGDVIPMSAHAVQAFDNLPGSILQMYITRIEAAAGMEGKRK